MLNDWFEGFHCECAQTHGREIDRHGFKTCYLSNLQLEQMERIAAAVVKNAQLVKIFHETSTSGWLLSV